MKVIYQDNITQISASEEDSAYPVENLFDNHTKKVWRGLSTLATLTIDLSGGSALGIANTNSLSIAGIVIEGPDPGAWEPPFSYELGATWDGVTWDGVAWPTSSGTWETTWDGISWAVEGSGAVGINLIDTDSGDAWIDYDTINSAHRITLTLTCDSEEIIEAGVVRAGHILEFSDPLYGVSETSIDTSIKKTLSNNSLYYRKRDVIRSYSCSLVLDRAVAARSLTRNIGITLGYAPLMWLLAEDGDSQWVVFGNSEMSQNHNNVTHNSVSLTVTEAI